MNLSLNQFQNAKDNVDVVGVCLSLLCFRQSSSACVGHCLNRDTSTVYMRQSKKEIHHWSEWIVMDPTDGGWVTDGV